MEIPNIFRKPEKAKEQSMMGNVPSLSKVGPIRHDHGAQHYIVLREVAREQVCGADHGHAKHVRYLIPVGGVSPLRPRLGLAVMVECIEVNWGLELGMEFGGGNCWRHPLVVRKQR